MGWGWWGQIVAITILGLGTQQEKTTTTNNKKQTNQKTNETLTCYHVMSLHQPLREPGEAGLLLEPFSLPRLLFLLDLSGFLGSACLEVLRGSHSPSPVDATQAR